MKPAPRREEETPTLIVERDPLRLAGALNTVEGDRAVVAVDAGQDCAVAGEVLFIEKGRCASVS